MSAQKRFRDRAAALVFKMGRSPSRVILDPRGIHHMRPTSRNFVESVQKHVLQRNRSSAEFLFIAERLTKSGKVTSKTDVIPQGAVLQTFRGIHQGPYEFWRDAAHHMHCQVVFDGKFPHQLAATGKNPYNNLFLDRNIKLFGGCSYQKPLVNSIDQTLDWNEDADFVGLYIQAIKYVLQGAEAEDAFRDYSQKKKEILRSLRELVQDIPLTEEQAIVDMGLVTSTTGETEPATTEIKEAEKLLNDKKALGELQSQKETVIEIYADKAAEAPAVETGELKAEVANENWDT